MEAENTEGQVTEAELEESGEEAKPLGGLTSFVRKVVVFVSSTCLALLMFLVASDVFCRYLFNHPIPGGYELIEYLMGMMVPLSVAYCAEQKAHVGVDLVVEKLSRRARAVVDMVTMLVTVALMSVLAWQSFVAFSEAYASGITSAVLKIPAYPLMLGLGVGFVAFVIFSIGHLVELVMEVFKK